MPVQSGFSFASTRFKSLHPSVRTVPCPRNTPAGLSTAKLSANSPPSFVCVLRRMVKQGLPVSLGMPTRRQARLRCWSLPRCPISAHSLTDACLRTVALQVPDPAHVLNRDPPIAPGLQRRHGGTDGARAMIVNKLDVKRCPASTITSHSQLVESTQYSSEATLVARKRPVTDPPWRLRDSLPGRNCRDHVVDESPPR